MHRWRQAGRPDSQLHGGGRQPQREEQQPLRLDRAQTGLHLWPAQILGRRSLLSRCGIPKSTRGHLGLTMNRPPPRWIGC
jgi:hypothetical protein